MRQLYEAAAQRHGCCCASQQSCRKDRCALPPPAGCDVAKLWELMLTRPGGFDAQQLGPELKTVLWAQLLASKVPHDVQLFTQPAGGGSQPSTAG